MKPITLRGALLLLLATASLAGSTNNDIVEFFLRDGWTQADLSRIVIDAPPALPAAGDPFPYVTRDGVARVVYRGTDNHIHELYLQGGWFQDDLFQIVINGGNPAPVPAAGDPFPYVTHDGIPHVVYLGTDQYIHALSLKGGWFQDDPSVINGPPVRAGGDPAAYVTPGGIPRIVYTGRDDGHIHELYLQGFWFQDDLSLLASQDCRCGDTISPIGHLFPYVAHDNIPRVVYRGTDEHIHELYLHDGWFPADLSQIVNAPPAASDPYPYVTNDGIARVVYRSYDNHIHELYLHGGWFQDDLSNLASLGCHCSPAPAGVWNPYAYVTPDGIPRVVYTGQDGHIHELYLHDGWFPDDLSSILVDPPAIPAGGNPRAYFTPDGIARVVFRSVP